MVTRTVWCVWMCFRNANRYRGRIGFSRCAHQAGWSLRFVSSTFVTHAPGPAAGEMSKNEGCESRGIRPELWAAAGAEQRVGPAIVRCVDAIRRRETSMRDAGGRLELFRWAKF